MSRRALLLMCAALIGPTAHAHKASDAYLQLSVQGPRVEQRFDIALRDLDRDLVLDANDDGQLSWGEVRTRWADIDRLARQGLRLTNAGKACEAGVVGPAQLDEHSDGRYVVLTRTWACATDVRELAVGYTLFAQTDPTHRGIARVQVNGATSGATRGDTQTAVLVPGAPAQRLLRADGSAQSSSVLTSVWSSSFGGFVAEGVHHILIGTDHLLFLLALLLPAVLVRRAPGGTPWQAAPSWRATVIDVLRVVTAFTVAHSLTLALAVLNVIDPPSRAVETVIAASVLLAALNNLRPVVGHGRWKLTFAFGLVHGFGFAGALKDLGLGEGALAAPLLGFNLGVELGQLAIVALFLPLAWALRRTQAYQRGALAGGSALIAVLALVWMVERGFDVQLFGL